MMNVPAGIRDMPTGGRASAGVTTRSTGTALLVRLTIPVLQSRTTKAWCTVIPTSVGSSFGGKVNVAVAIPPGPGKADDRSPQELPSGGLFGCTSVCRKYVS